MDSIEALDRICKSLSNDASVLDFSPSEVTGDCASHIQEIVRQRKSGKVTEDTLDRAISCSNNEQCLVYLGGISAGLGCWNCAIKANEKALPILEKLGNAFGKAKVYNNLGLVYTDMGKWNKAIDYYQKSLEIEKNIVDRRGVAITLTNLGRVYNYNGEWSIAIQYYQDSLEILEKLGDAHLIAITLTNLGVVYNNTGERSKAIECYQRSLATFEKFGDMRSIAQTYHLIGVVHYFNREWNNAIEYYQKGLEIKEKLGDIYSAGETYNNLGLVYVEISELDNAIECYQKSLEIKEKLGDMHGKGITLSNLGKLYLDKGHFDTAQNYLEESIRLMNKEARPDYPNALSWLASCCHKLGSEKKALAKREKDPKKRQELVDSAANLFSDASLHYNEVAYLPRVYLPTLMVYANLDRGLSYSVKNITEQDESKAIVLLENALNEFKEALEFADEREEVRLQSVISDHEAKRYLRLTALEKDRKKQDILLDKAIEELEKAAKFEILENEDQCKSSTCEGCMHLFKGLKLFREGIKDYNKSKKDTNIAINASLDELAKAKNCYDKVENELGMGTIKILNDSFDYVEKLIKRKDEMFVASAAHEFNKIIEELSSVGLRKMVKIFTFDESLRVKKEESSEGKRIVNINNVDNVFYSEGSMHFGLAVDQPASMQVQGKSKPLISKIAEIVTVAGFAGWASGLVFLIYGYSQSNAYSLIIGIIVIVFLTVLKLKKDY